MGGVRGWGGVGVAVIQSAISYCSRVQDLNLISPRISWQHGSGGGGGVAGP